MKFEIINITQNGKFMQIELADGRHFLEEINKFSIELLTEHIKASDAVKAIDLTNTAIISNISKDYLNKEIEY